MKVPKLETCFILIKIMNLIKRPSSTRQLHGIVQPQLASCMELNKETKFNSPVKLASPMELKSLVALARPVPCVTLSQNSSMPFAICIDFM